MKKRKGSARMTQIGRCEKRWVIVEYSAYDPFELVTNIFDNYIELAQYLGIEKASARHLLYRQAKNHVAYRGKRYEKVRLDFEIE